MELIVNAGRFESHPPIVCDDAIVPGEGGPVIRRTRINSFEVISQLDEEFHSVSHSLSDQEILRPAEGLDIDIP